MKRNVSNNKKAWEKPAIDLMNIKRDTFGGSGINAEDGNKASIKYVVSVNSRGGRR